jgi:hypothetical protein
MPGKPVDGTYSPKRKLILLNLPYQTWTKKEVLRTLFHETVHAIQEATGLSAKTVEGKWRDGWNDPFFKIAAVLNTNVLWGIGGVLLLAGAVRRRQKTKEKLARWEAEEAAAQERIRARRWLHAEPREH